MVIAETPGIELVGEAGTGEEAVRLVRSVRPDVVVMDIRMPGMDGIEATRQLMPDPGTARVLILTTFDDDEYVYAALRAGASGFLVKDMALEDIVQAIRVVAAGDALIAPSVTRRLIAEFAAPSATAAPPRSPAGGHRVPDSVTARETRGAHAGRPRHVEPRDRRAAHDQRRHGEGARGAAAGQTRAPGTGCSS